MSIFDAIKKASNYLSGGGANLQIALDDSLIPTEGKVRVSIFCQIKEHEILVDKLYLSIKAEETVRYRDQNYSTSSGSRRGRGSTNRSSTVTTHKQEVIVDENFRLDANGEYEWESEFFLPEGVEGTYRGVNAHHTWKVRAGLSKKGNDPNSGWTTFIV